ncbi:sensor histidine kinase [Intestinibacter bartlettii]|uniref:histidine kinase n=1 Tax=Intestinibacter bartlettii TaxID=261299 RepID=A0ABS6DUC8_9FIRM|nr:HAMP domain-containing sensor histidine kinase [Intestinibacter bartlettii]MBU5335426.1 HAMP domain-containing histidine kinase [Intestinibacter bartlettii]
MKKLKLFQKTYLFTMVLMAIIILISHTLLYMLLPTFYISKKQHDLETISTELVQQLEVNNKSKSNKIAENFADKHNINILLNIGGEKRVYEGIKQCDIYIDSDLLDEDLLIDNKVTVEKDKNMPSLNNNEGFFKFKDSSLLYSKDITTADDESGSIKVAMDLQYIQEARSVVFMLLPYSIGISLIISLFASYLYVKRITKPIQQICDATKEMKVLKEDARCNINTGDEIEELATNINSLYKTLWDTIDSLKQEIENVSKSEKSKVDFLRSASHELKTPLMSIHIMLENMMYNVGKYKNHDVYLPKCKDAVVNLSNMVQEILDTSRLNTWDNNKEYEVVDLKCLIENIIEPYKIIAKSKRINMNIDYSNSLTIKTDKALLNKALSNIISNAVNYTDKDKNIDIYFRENSLIIENECEPIPQKHLEYIFDAFYRAEFDRNKNTGGNGLGLYIVKQILKSLNVPYSFEGTETGMEFSMSFEEI